MINRYIGSGVLSIQKVTDVIDQSRHRGTHTSNATSTRRRTRTDHRGRAFRTAAELRGLLHRHPASSCDQLLGDAVWRRHEDADGVDRLGEQLTSIKREVPKPRLTHRQSIRFRNR
jgi:hypothetical protein